MSGPLSSREPASRRPESGSASGSRPEPEAGSGSASGSGDPGVRSSAMGSVGSGKRRKREVSGAGDRRRGGGRRGHGGRSRRRGRRGRRTGCRLRGRCGRRAWLDGDRHRDRQEGIERPVVRAVGERVRAAETVVRLVADPALLTELEIAVGRATDELCEELGAIEVGVVGEDAGLVDIEACLDRGSCRNPRRRWAAAGSGPSRSGGRASAAAGLSSARTRPAAAALAPNRRHDPTQDRVTSCRNDASSLQGR